MTLKSLFLGVSIAAIATSAYANDTLNDALKTTTDALASAKDTVVTVGGNLVDSLQMDTKTVEYSGVRVGNPIDPKTWWDGSKNHEGHAVEVNFADPEFYMSIINPKTHSGFHHTMTNPSTWAQFIKPSTYVKMMNVDTWSKWLDAKSYAPLTDIQTYAYWAQPGAYAHGLNPKNWGQMLEVSNYEKLATEVEEAVSKDELDQAATVLNPFSWFSGYDKKEEAVKTEG